MSMELLLLRRKSVTNADFCFDEAGRILASLELLPQMRDINAEILGLAFRFLAPNRAE